MASAGTEGQVLDEDIPLEMSVNNEAFFLADVEPMGVVAEVIRNDMGDSLGIVVYDDITKQVHRFRSSQLVVRPDGNVTVLPSWFRKSREILRSIEPMEQSIPLIRKAKRKGMKLTEEQAAQATSEAPADVQRFIDEAVILRSQLIGKLHRLSEKQKAAQAQLHDLANPGLFDRTPEADRVLMIATFKRSNRLNEQTIHAMRDFLISMDTSYLFPKDPRYRSLFKMEEFQAVEEATPVLEGEEFETFEEEEVAEFDSFDEVEDFASVEQVEEFDTVEDFAPFPDGAETRPEAPPAPPIPPPPPPAAAAAATVPSYDHVEALPDDDEMTVQQQPSLMTVGGPGWTPPQPAGAMAPLPPPAPYATGMPPPPPGATQVPPPVPMQQMDALEASAQRKIEGEPAAPQPVAKKAGLLGRLRRGREKQARPPAGAVAAGAVAGGAVASAASKDVEEFAPVEEFTPLQATAPPPAPPIPRAAAMPPPPSIPPPPAYTPHVDTFQSVDEFETFSEPAPAAAFAPVQAAPVAPPPGAPTVTPQPLPAPAPVPAPAPAPIAVAEFETFEEEEEVAEFGEVVEEEVDRPLDAEKDIDSILAMALGKAPAPGTRPTARPGEREELGSPMKSLMSKTKYRRS